METAKELQRAEQKEEPQVYREKGDLAYWANMALSQEEIRVATQVSISHLGRTERASPERERFLELAKAAEDYADGRLAALIVAHPTWPWAERQKGLGKENYPKVIGQIEKFGRYFDPGDPLIPSFVKRPVARYLTVNETGKVVEVEGIWVEGIERLATPSKQWKYAGMNVDPATGLAPKRKAGEKLPFNADLRMLLYRLATSLIRAKGVWYENDGRDGTSPGYLGYRNRIAERKAEQGITVIPTPKERVCTGCGQVVTRKAARYCPECGGELTKKDEASGYLHEGHLHLMAMREMMKDWLVCMWIVWREALGLPVTQPYKVVYQKHPPVDPWVMVDK